MSGNTSLVSSTPGFVTGTFGAKDVRLATMGNELPGLFARGDFAVTQRAAGANMSVDIGDGRAFVSPEQSTHQGLYLARKSAGTQFNTSADGGYTWTAADGSNPRIDLVCLEVKDTAEDASGTTGYRIRIVDGTPAAGATSVMLSAYWPAVPAGCVPLAYTRLAAGATTITTANILNLNAVGGRAANALAIATEETTTSASFTNLTTPDLLAFYCPSAAAVVQLLGSFQAKISVASGTQSLTMALGSAGSAATQVTANDRNGAAASLQWNNISMSTLYGNGATQPYVSGGTATNSLFQFEVGTGADSVDGNVLGHIGAAAAILAHPVFIRPGAAGWYYLMFQALTSANTLSVKNRLWNLQVLG